MPKLTRKEREDILDLIRKEELTLLDKANKQAIIEWSNAEKELAENIGMSDSLARAEHLREQIQEAQRELNELEKGHEWRYQEPSDREYVEAGLEPPERTRWGAIIEHRSPEVFGKKIITKWNLEIFKILNKKMNILEVHRILNQSGDAVRREILLSGTFEEVRTSYQRFYQLLKQAGGKEIPPLLNSIIEVPVLLPGSEERLDDDQGI